MSQVRLLVNRQERAEWVGAMLCALCIVVPWLEQRLQETLPGRGRLAASSTLAGASRTFALSANLSEEAKQVGVGGTLSDLLHGNQASHEQHN